jgi:HEPN domain-containing protein
MPEHSADRFWEELLQRVAWELETARAALREGNEGKARVCARRAVGWFVQALAQVSAYRYGSHIGENLRRISQDEQLPEEVRAAAARLQGGARAQLSGELYSLYPLRDAGIILRYFAQQVGCAAAMERLIAQSEQ